MSTWERLLARRTITPSGCWEFRGARHTFGYGLLQADGKLQGTHRLAWAEVNGPIPDGMHVLHACDNPPCFNPKHLFVGTPLDNMRDKVAKGRHRAGVTPRWRNHNALKTHCPKGHPYNEANTWVDSGGSRFCRTCNRERQRARKASRPAGSA